MTVPKTHPKYESPRIVTYQEDEILKQMGPIGGCNSPDYSPSAPMRLQQDIPGKRGLKYRSSLRSADFEEGLRKDEEGL